jgi:hypothetical protein
MARQRPALLLQNFLVANRHPHCLVQLLLAARPRQVPQTPWCQLQQTHALSQLLYHPGPLFRFRLSFFNFSRVFCPQVNAVGLNLDGSQTAHFESSSTPQVTTSFYGACYSIYIIIHNENYPHCTNLQVQNIPLANETGIVLIILTPMKILQRNFTFRRQCCKSASNCFAISSLVVKLWGSWGLDGVGSG